LSPDRNYVLFAPRGLVQQRSQDPDADTVTAATWHYSAHGNGAVGSGLALLQQAPLSLGKGPCRRPATH
jgi:hypothetical protein